MSSSQAFPSAGSSPIRRVVTGHTSDGKAVVLDDSHIEPHSIQQGPSLFADIFWSEANPDENTVEWKDKTKEHITELVGPSGSSFRSVQIPPGGSSPFHRTVTLDYGIVTRGSITLILDDDKRVKLNAGDVIVQRGTIHGWYNENDEWTHMIFVMIPAQNIKLGEKQLEEEFLPLDLPNSSLTKP